MLRLDRYLPSPTGALDLATGSLVALRRSTPLAAGVELFQRRGTRTLIDFDAIGARRIEVWDHWEPCRVPRDVEAITIDFVELLECARLGAPRAFDLACHRSSHADYYRRILAREARTRGFIPLALEMLASTVREHRYCSPPWLVNRSVVIFADGPRMSQDAVLALLHLAHRDARPHVLVRTRSNRPARLDAVRHRHTAVVVHEEVERLAANPAAADVSDAVVESRARWQVLIDGVDSSSSPAHTLDLAKVLMSRDQLFESRAVLESVQSSAPDVTAQAATIAAALDERAAARTNKGWDMVDDFVDVLQMCQDVEDEKTALARVGAFLRERLQASSVAFVARDGVSPVVLTRVGSSAAGVDLALRTIETGVATAPPRQEGPVESAAPVRHAAEVIGALWCRWSAGMTIAPQQATTLLGMAAAVAAPSLRLALARLAPITRDNPIPELVGESTAMASVRDAIVRAAASPFPVVIEGESGSGKELAARAIHARSVRRDRKFCAINCAALVDDLVEAELFGHARGAFTGATADRPGLFEDAAGGTLFMDEIAELGARVQAKLLRVLQDGEIRRVGETQVRKADVRVVAATNRPLAREVAAGRFRSDLWYRLDVVRITLPPLRERIDDLPLLARHLWQSLASRVGSRAVLSPGAIAALAAYNWPGNIRELQNVLASMLVSAPRAGLVGPASLPAHIARVAASEREATLAVARRQFEQRYVRAALARSGGRTAEAARHLGLTRQGLTKLMGRLGIEQDGHRAADGMS